MPTQEVIEEEGDITDKEDSITPRKIKRDLSNDREKIDLSLNPISEEASYREEGSPIDRAYIFRGNIAEEGRTEIGGEQDYRAKRA